MKKYKDIIENYSPEYNYIRSKSKYDSDIMIEYENKFSTPIKEEKKKIDYFSEWDKELRCTICFNIDLKNKCFLSECKHEFCLDCIIEWLNYNSICPLCKSNNEFIINYFDDKKIKIEKREPNVDDFEVLELEIDEVCYACDSEENEDDIIVCSHCNFKVCHTYCWNPTLNELTDDDWYCDYCVRDHNLDYILPIVGIFIPKIKKNNPIFRTYKNSKNKAMMYKDLLKDVIIYPHITADWNKKQKEYLFRLTKYIN